MRRPPARDPRRRRADEATVLEGAASAGDEVRADVEAQPEIEVLPQWLRRRVSRADAGRRVRGQRDIELVRDQLIAVVADPDTGVGAGAAGRVPVEDLDHMGRGPGWRVDRGPAALIRPPGSGRCRRPAAAGLSQRLRAAMSRGIARSPRPHRPRSRRRSRSAPPRRENPRPRQRGFRQLRDDLAGVRGAPCGHDA